MFVDFIALTAAFLYDKHKGGFAMYSQTDITDINTQLKRRIIAWLLPAALLLALVIAAFVARIEWLTAALFALLGCLLLFSLSLYILPLIKYRRFLALAIHGRQRRSVVAFKKSDNDTVMRDGVNYYPLLFTAGLPQEAMDDRLFYWDANLPLPAWKPGEKLVLFSHEKALTHWEAAAADEALQG